MGEPMQASGKGTTPGKGDEAIWNQGGESGGDANHERDHAGGKGKQGGILGHGGQSEIAYHGPADGEADGANANAGAQGE